MTSLRHSQSRTRPGFTLVEMLFTLAISSFILTGIVTSYVLCLRGFRGLGNYNEIQADGRQALDWLARDVRPALAVSSCSSTQVVVLLPATVSASGVVTATNTITHRVNAGLWSRIDNAGGSKPLATNVTSVTFSLYDKNGNATAVASQAASVQVDAVLTKQVQNNVQSSEFLSARYRMRNAP